MNMRMADQDHRSDVQLQTPTAAPSTAPPSPMDPAKDHRSDVQLPAPTAASSTAPSSPMDSTNEPANIQPHQDHVQESLPEAPADPEAMKELADEIDKLHNEADHDHQMRVLMYCLQKLGG